MNPIDFNNDLPPEQRQLREQTHRFAAEVMRPASLELDALSPEDVIAPASRLRDVFREAYKAGYHLRGSHRSWAAPGSTRWTPGWSAKSSAGAAPGFR